MMMMNEAVTNKTLEKIKYDLVREGLVEYEVIEKAQELATAQNISIGQALINLNILSEETLLKFMESKLHIPFRVLFCYKSSITLYICNKRYIMFLCHFMFSCYI